MGFLRAFILGLVVCGLILVSQPVLAQARVQGYVELIGRISPEEVGNRFIVDGHTIEGQPVKVKVDPGKKWFHQLGISQYDTVVVAGDVQDGVMMAQWLQKPDGTVVMMQEGVPQKKASLFGSKKQVETKPAAAKQPVQLPQPTRSNKYEGGAAAVSTRAVQPPAWDQPLELGTLQRPPQLPPPAKKPVASSVVDESEVVTGDPVISEKQDFDIDPLSPEPLPGEKTAELSDLLDRIAAVGGEKGEKVELKKSETKASVYKQSRSDLLDLMVNSQDESKPTWIGPMNQAKVYREEQEQNMAEMTPASSLSFPDWDGGLNAESTKAEQGLKENLNYFPKNRTVPNVVNKTPVLKGLDAGFAKTQKSEAEVASAVVKEDGAKIKVEKRQKPVVKKVAMAKDDLSKSDMTMKERIAAADPEKDTILYNEGGIRIEKVGRPKPPVVANVDQPAGDRMDRTALVSLAPSQGALSYPRSFIDPRPKPLAAGQIAAETIMAEKVRERYQGRAKQRTSKLQQMPIEVMSVSKDLNIDTIQSIAQASGQATPADQQQAAGDAAAGQIGQMGQAAGSFPDWSQLPSE